MVLSKLRAPEKRSSKKKEKKRKKNEKLKITKSTDFVDVLLFASQQRVIIQLIIIEIVF